MKITSPKNQNGFTLIELLITMVISMMILGTAIYTFNRQEKLLRTERQETNVRATGRIILTDLSDNILMSGLGVPAGMGIMDSSDADSLVLIANTDNIHTMAVADVAAGATQIDVQDASQFQVGDWVSIMQIRRYTQFLDNSGTLDLNWGQLVQLTGVNTGAGRLSFTNIPGAPANYSASTMSTNHSTSDGIMVSKVHALMYSYDGLNEQLLFAMDADAFASPAVTTPIATNIGGLSFVYKDAAGATLNLTTANNYKLVRNVEVVLGMEDVINPNANITFNSDLNLRNNGV